MWLVHGCFLDGCSTARARCGGRTPLAPSGLVTGPCGAVGSRLERFPGTGPVFLCASHSRTADRGPRSAFCGSSVFGRTGTQRDSVPLTTDFHLRCGTVASVHLRAVTCCFSLEPFRYPTGPSGTGPRDVRDRSPVSGEDRSPPRAATVPRPGCSVPARAVQSPAIEDRSPTPSLGPRRGTRPVLLVNGRALAVCPSATGSPSNVRRSGDVVCQGP